MNYHPKRKSVPHPAVIAGLSLLAAIAVVAAIFTAKAQHSKKTISAEQAPSLVYDSSAVEGGWENLSPEVIEAALNEKVSEGMINISMNTAPYYEDGSAEGNVMIVNEAINNYPQKVEFIRNDTGETIYASNAIPVGSKIERAALDVELPAGTYECTAMFHNLDPATGDMLGTAGAIITITIQN